MFIRSTLILHLFFALPPILTLGKSKQISEPVTKIVAIHSYADDFPWTHIISNSYLEELKRQNLRFDVRSFYFDVKKHPYSLKEPHPLLKEIDQDLKTLSADLIFITDDFALQQMAPMLIKNQIPFVFAGINGDVPASIANSSFKKYSGVFERYYISNSVHLLQRLLGKNKLKILILLEDSETSTFVAEYSKLELKKLPNIEYDFLTTNDFSQWQERVLSATPKYDAYFPIQPYSLKTKDGTYVPPAEIVKWFYDNANKPTIYTAGWHIKCGGTLAIAHRPQAQGAEAAKISLMIIKTKAFRHPYVPPQGDIAINFASTKKLQIRIPFDLLTTATIEKTVEQPCNPK
jgi:hypothetical protein